MTLLDLKYREMIDNSSCSTLASNENWQTTVSLPHPQLFISDYPRSTPLKYLKYRPVIDNIYHILMITSASQSTKNTETQLLPVSMPHPYLGSDVGDGRVLSVGHVLLEIFDGSHEEGDPLVEHVLQRFLRQRPEA